MSNDIYGYPSETDSPIQRRRVAATGAAEALIGDGAHWVISSNGGIVVHVPTSDYVTWRDRLGIIDLGDAPGGRAASGNVFHGGTAVDVALVAHRTPEGARMAVGLPPEEPYVEPEPAQAAPEPVAAGAREEIAQWRERHDQEQVG